MNLLDNASFFFYDCEEAFKIAVFKTIVDYFYDPTSWQSDTFMN